MPPAHEGLDAAELHVACMKRHFRLVQKREFVFVQGAFQLLARDGRRRAEMRCAELLCDFGVEGT